MNLKILFLALALLLSCVQAAFAWESYIAKSYAMYVNEILPANMISASDKRGPGSTPHTIKFYGIGIPTPRQPFGIQAHQFLLELLPRGAKIIVSVIGEDEEGVLTGLVQYKDHSVNNALVEKGYAWVERRSCKAFFCRRWHIQEHIAVKEKRGVWSLNSTRAPWQWSDQ